MPIIVSSSIGQSLIVGPIMIPLHDPDEVRATTGSAVSIMETHGNVHSRLQEAFNSLVGSPDAPALIVSSTGGQSLIAGPVMVPFRTPDEVRTALRSHAIQVLEVDETVHTRLQDAFNSIGDDPAQG